MHGFEGDESDYDRGLQDDGRYDVVEPVRSTETIETSARVAGCVMTSFTTTGNIGETALGGDAFGVHPNTSPSGIPLTASEMDDLAIARRMRINQIGY